MVEVMSHFHTGSNVFSEIIGAANVKSKLGWTIPELAASLGLSVPFLRLEARRGHLRVAHFGRRVVVLDSEVRRYLEEGERRS